MLQSMLNEINNTIRITVPHKKIVVSFSGGVDSAFLAKICSDLKYDVTLLTIGFENCHDILFAKQISHLINLPHKTYEIDYNEFNEIKQHMKKKINVDSISWIENSIAFYYISKVSRQLGFDVIVTANGIDELFCGYDIYRRIMPCSDDKILQTMNIKLKNEISMLNKISSISSIFDITLVHPFLLRNFIEFAKQVPLFYKIRGENDFLRKHIIRTLAFQVGVPKISAYKRKKSMQYGSAIHKFI